MRSTTDSPAANWRVGVSVTVVSLSEKAMGPRTGPLQRAKALKLAGVKVVRSTGRSKWTTMGAVREMLLALMGGSVEVTVSWAGAEVAKQSAARAARWMSLMAAPFCAQRIGRALRARLSAL